MLSLFFGIYGDVLVYLLLQNLVNISCTVKNEAVAASSGCNWSFLIRRIASYFIVLEMH